jgi:tetratricopeptide (TPR) repeat protein
VAAQEGRYVADKLLPFIKKVRALQPDIQGAGWTNESRAQVKILLADALSAYSDQAGDSAALNEAIAEYKEALSLDPDNARTHNNLGVALDKRASTPTLLPNTRKASGLTLAMGRCIAT